MTFSASVNVVSVERDGVIIIPKGSTDFKDGDIVTLFGSKDDLAGTKQNFLRSVTGTEVEHKAG
jgi:CIC family chloride channel protein